MSLNQSRADKSEPSQYRKSSRSGSFNQQRNFGGRGKGGGGAPAHPTSWSPSLSSNQSFKKSNNAQGGQSRTSVLDSKSDFNNASADRIVQNGAHFQPPLHGAADAPLIGANVKPTDVSTQKSTRPVPKVPSSNAATVMSVTMEPTTPAKDASKSFPLQFGSISPGFMNGMQIPARTSSAPPNLDEQKRDQARHDLLRAGLTLPMPSIPIPKQQLPRKDAGTVDQSNIDETHPTPKVKRGVQVSAASHVVETQKPSVHSIPGISMQIPFHQPQVPSQSNTGETNPTPKVKRDVQVSVASPVVQTQKPSVHPIPGSTRKTVKITHPDTHEELRLDGSSGQRSQDDIDKAAENFVTSTFTVQDAIYTKPSPSALDLSTISLGDKASIVDISLTGNDGIWTKEVDGTTSGMLDQHSARASVPPLSEATLKFEGEGAEKISAGLVSLSALGSKDKPLPKPNRGKSNMAKQRRHRKELLQKGDAAGTSQNVDQSKAEPDDWKDAADISTPKLGTYEERATSFQKGLIPSPHTPSQVIHKAEKKYEVGKVTDEEQTKQRQLKSILNKLTPRNFEKLFEQVKQVKIDNAVTLTGVISQIYDKALMEPSFCEMYAIFCSHLAGDLPDLNVGNEKITFKRLLLNKCQEEFERGEREEEANKSDEEGDVKQSEQEREEKRIRARRRMLGTIRVIGELYKKEMLTERIMHECINKLLRQPQNPDEEDVEALCKLMSTIGVMIDHPKAQEHMDAYFDIMARLSNNMKLSSRVRFMLKDAIDLRKNKWPQRRMLGVPKRFRKYAGIS